jgi:hypothetical protein
LNVNNRCSIRLGFVFQIFLELLNFLVLLVLLPLYDRTYDSEDNDEGKVQVEPASNRCLFSGLELFGKGEFIGKSASI